MRCAPTRAARRETLRGCRANDRPPNERRVWRPAFADGDLRALIRPRPLVARPHAMMGTRGASDDLEWRWPEQGDYRADCRDEPLAARKLSEDALVSQVELVAPGVRR